MGINASSHINDKKESQSKTLKNEVDSLYSVLGLSQLNTEREELLKTNKNLTQKNKSNNGDAQ